MTTPQEQLPLEPFLLPSDEKAKFARRFPVHVGVDTGKSFHKMVARAKVGARRQPIRVDVSRDGFEAADHYLRRTFPRIARRRTLVGIEGAGSYGFTFASFLTGRGYHVVEVPAFATSHTRELDDRSPRKDDDKDAAQICGLLASGIFVRSPVVGDWITGLRLLVQERDRLVRDRRRVGNQLGQLLTNGWPEFEVHFGDLDSDYVRLILQTWPLPNDFGRARPLVVLRLLRGIGSRWVQLPELEQARSAAKSTIGLETAIDARREGIRRAVTHWEFLHEQIDAIDQHLTNLVAQDAGGRALLTVPRVKLSFASTFLSALGNPADFDSPRQVLKLAGLNLTRRQSGTTVLTAPHIARRGRRLLRVQLYMLAARWCKPDGLLRDEFLAMVVRNGGKKKKAIVAMGRRLVPLLLHIAKSGESFDLERWNLSRRTTRPNSVARMTPA